MSSKLLLALCAGISLASLESCSLYEGPPAQRKEGFQQNSLACMKDFRAKVLAYVDGNATPEDVQRLSDCSIKALHTFAEFTQGENRDRFTAHEVRNFLQRYFLEDVVISDSFLKEFMRVKQAFLGGKSTDFSREDLKSAERFIEVFRDVLLRLQPTMPFTMARVERASPTYVDESGKALVDAAEILGGIMTEKKSTYSFEDMGRLFDEIMLVFKGSKSVLTTVRSHIQLAGVLKEIMISPYRPREVVTAGDWRIILQEGSRWAATYFRMINMNAQYPDWTRGEGRARLGLLLGEGLGHLDRVVARHCPDEPLMRGGCKSVPGIPIKTLQSLVDTLDWDGRLIGIQFKKETIQSLFVPFIKRILAGEDVTETGRNTNRLTSVHIDRLRSLIREWLDGSRYLEGSFASVLHTDSFSDSTSLPILALVGLQPDAVLRSNGGTTPSAVSAAESLREIFNKTIAIADDESRGAVFDGKNGHRPRVYRELARYAWLRPIFKRVVLGYIEGKNRVTRAKNFEYDGLTVDELTTFIKDFWQPLRDFKLVGPKNSPIGDGKRRFREASLFTHVSDGNLLISVDEGMQLVLYMFSVNPLSVDLHDRAEQICPKGPLDDYEQPTIEPVCYRAKMYDFSSKNTATADLWKPFPALIQYYDGLDISRQLEFQEYVEGASRKSGISPQAWFASSDTQTTAMMFHYLEELFVRFDGNGDGLLDREEAEAAFPMFANTLAVISGMKPSDGKLKSVFFYLLANGAPPVDDNMGAWRKFWNGTGFYLYWHLYKPSFTADRLSVLEVFSTLAKAK